MSLIVPRRTGDVLYRVARRLCSGCSLPAVRPTQANADQDRRALLGFLRSRVRRGIRELWSASTLRRPQPDVWLRVDVPHTCRRRSDSVGVRKVRQANSSAFRLHAHGGGARATHQPTTHLIRARGTPYCGVPTELF